MPWSLFLNKIKVYDKKSKSIEGQCLDISGIPLIQSLTHTMRDRQADYLDKCEEKIDGREKKKKTGKQGAKK